MKNPTLSDIGLSIGLLLLSAILYWQASLAPLSWFPGDVGVAAVPKVLIICLALLSAILLVQSAVKLKAASQQNDTNFNWLKLLEAAVILVAYIIVLDLQFIPYALSSFVFTFFMIQTLSSWTKKNIIISTIISAITVAAVVLIFETLFMVVLP